MTSKEAYKSTPVLHNGHTPETVPQREEWNSGLPLCILLSSSLSSPFQWPWKLYPQPGHSLRRSIRHTAFLLTTTTLISTSPQASSRIPLTTAIRFMLKKTPPLRFSSVKSSRFLLDLLFLSQHPQFQPHPQ
ncbi:uncharacterized protein LOC142817744 [Rhipicephalus microplus]|uniref:uncharacterized protein LOC142817744 n=1 Tax=Rhipicephalus microplus TaxID=6941 RepID=UPI003F6BF211